MTIDKIGKAKYVTKFDLLKGFWQIPLTDKAKEASAFVTPDGLFSYSLLSIPRISRDWAKYVELSLVRGNQNMTFTYHFGAKYL